MLFILESNKRTPPPQVEEILVKDTGQEEEEEEEVEQEAEEEEQEEAVIEAKEEETVIEVQPENGQSTDTEDVLELGLTSSDITSQSDRERSVEGDQRIGEVFRDENEFRSNRGGRGRGGYRGGFRGHNKFQQMDRGWVPFQQQPFLMRGTQGPNGPMMRPQQPGRMPLHGGGGGARGGPFGGPRPYFNNFMQPRPGPSLRPRFFYQNAAPVIPETPPGPPFPSNPNTIQGNSGRKVLINPNFKGAVEAATNQLFKDQFYANRLSDVELQRQQQEFINKNLRCVEKRRHDRTPSPDYGPSSRRFSKSPTPPPRRNSIRSGYSSRYHSNRANSKDKDPAEDEATRDYRQQIESQKQKREEIIRQKEMRRKQVAEQKQKQTQPEDRLRPIIVTEKKIILKRAKITELSPEKSSTPPRTILKPKSQTIADPQSSNRRIVLKPSVGGPKVPKLELVTGSKSNAITEPIKRKNSGII